MKWLEAESRQTVDSENTCFVPSDVQFGNEPIDEQPDELPSQVENVSNEQTTGLYLGDMSTVYNR